MTTFLESEHLIPGIQARQRREVYDIRKQERLKEDGRELKPDLHIVVGFSGPDTSTIAETYTDRIKWHGEQIHVVPVLHELGRVSMHVIDRIEELNESEHCDGLMIQLPLPIADEQLRAEVGEEFCNAVSIHKDVEGLAPNSEFPHPAAVGMINLLEHYGIDVENKIVTINGSEGRFLGRAAVHLFKERGANVIGIDIANEQDENAYKQKLSESIKESDILVSAANHQAMITESMLRDGQVVLDAGLSSLIAGRRSIIVGDVDPAVYNSNLKIKITPTPGGSGPMTVSALYDNLISTAKNS